ncbi:MAG: methionyl-tRNA formyltransferase [Bacteroidales bacterium]
MKPEETRIVYMGTPEFAVRPLQQLIDEGFSVVGVVTAPDRPAGRGKKLRESAVKEFIRKHHPEVPLLQPPNLKDPGFVNTLRDLRPDLQAVVAFRMLPEVVWRVPQLGTFNLHASLLPQYRGAAPINHALMNGETETGVTTFLIDEQIDTGNILLQERVAIGDNETAGDLHDRLMAEGSQLVLETVRGMAQGSLQARPQDQFIHAGESLKKAPKITKEECRIDWNRPGRILVNQIRGLSPVPGAFTTLGTEGDRTQLWKIYRASFEPVLHEEPPGTIHTDGKQTLKVAVRDGYLQIESIQIEGKKRMEVPHFLAGFRFTSGQNRFA